MNIIQSPSPNFSSRQGYKSEIIVVHITDGYYPSDLDTLRNPNLPSPVSSHFYIAPNGDVHQLVSEDNQAWHAGVIYNPTFKNLKKNIWGSYINPNLYTIGIEISLRDLTVIVSEQYNSLKWLIKNYLSPKLNISIDRDHIIGHKEIRNNKTCPGTIDVDKLVLDMGQIDKDKIKKQIIELINKL